MWVCGVGRVDCVLYLVEKRREAARRLGEAVLCAEEGPAVLLPHC